MVKNYKGFMQALEMLEKRDEFSLCNIDCF